MGIIVPDYVRANQEMGELVERTKQRAMALDKALKDLDPRLSCVYVMENAPARYGMKPGFFHVRRQNDPPAANTYIPIQTPEGGFREPDSGVLDELRHMDMWKHGIPQLEKVDAGGGFYRHQFPEDPAKKREEDRVSEQQGDEMRENFRAAKRVAGDGGLKKKKWGRG